MTRDRSPLDEVAIGPATKGFPATEAPVPLADIGSLGWTLEDLQPPVLTLRRSAIEHNLALMAEYCRDLGVDHAPHGKTTMSPQLWRAQLGAGAWGITAATAVQARAMRAAGVGRILIANELTDAPSIAWAVGEGRREGELISYVDSDRGVDLLADASSPTEPLDVVVEIGHAHGRTGCRDPGRAEAIARRVAGTPGLRLRGVAAYEGTVARDRDEDSLQRVRAFIQTLAELATTTSSLVDGPVVVTAGGSVYFDVVAETLASVAGAHVLLRSGCYVTHDAGMYERTSPFAELPEDRRFHDAIRVWGTVLSVPERGRALVGVGRRDVPWDQDLPRPVERRRRDGAVETIDGPVRVTALNDQHAFCDTDDVDLREGDLIGLAISHPCTAFDRWRVIAMLDDDDRVVDAIATLF